MLRVCAHGPCQVVIPSSADRRRRYCSDAHRKAADRVRRTTALIGRERPQAPAGGDGSRYPALRAVWDLIARQIATEGVTVVGAAGVSVAHPLMRFLGALDAALSAHERAPDGDGPADPVEAARAAAVAALEAYRRGQGE